MQCMALVTCLDDEQDLPTESQIYAVRMLFEPFLRR